MDIHKYNQAAWDHLVQSGNRWTVPASSEVIELARQGDWSIVLTPTKPVPLDWFPELAHAEVLCLASGGGQQGPILAAAGAQVTVFDASSKQLGQDRQVADRDGLDLRTIQGDMADLSCFDDEQFELIFHPCSNSFVPQVRPVWAECFRVLRPGGLLLAGFVNPIRYIFDLEAMEDGRLEVRHSVPYSDIQSLDASVRQRLLIDQQEPLEFGHTLADQMGGQIDAGFSITGFYEDRYGAEDADPLSAFIATFIATRAIKAG